MTELALLLILILLAWYAGRCNARMTYMRQAGRALWVVCHRARERGVFFSPLDKAIIDESGRRLR